MKRTSQQIVDLCGSCAQINRLNKFRQGNVLSLPDKGKVVVTGDIHGHTRNFEKIVTFADLENNPQSHLIFQEILHGGPEDEQGGCLSFLLFFEILDYQQRFPDQVHLIIGNHDTAIIHDKEVLKGGKEMNRSLRNAMKRLYPDNYDAVEAALCDYLFSQPLAVKCANRIWMSHSLPADKFVDTFDMSVFDRPLTMDDLVRPNPAYLLTWGRNHSDQALKKIAKLLDVDLFVLGHQSQENGFSVAGFNLLILASEHNHGCILEFDLSIAYAINQLAQNVIPIASLQ